MQRGPLARHARFMQTKQLSLLVACLCLGAAAAVGVWSRESLAEALPPGARDESSAPPPAAPAEGADETAPTATEAVYRPSGGPAEAVAAPAERVDTRTWTSGVVKGDIRVPVSVIDQITSLTVILEEARNPFGNDGGGFERPYRRVESIPLDTMRRAGTPTFELREVPFSEYPYVVSVFAPKLNGTRRTIVVDKDHALVDDVVLAITPGAPLSVLVRDQDAMPYTGVDVVLLPVDEPHGRPAQHGTTDNAGSLVFEAVLAGDYNLTASELGQPLAEPQRVSVQPGNQLYSTKVQGQSCVATIPRGVQVQVSVHDSAGYGIRDAKVTATATDRVKLTTLPTQTDPIGRATFPHLQPGVWQLTIECDGYQRVDQQLRLTAGQEPQFRDIKLVRTKR